MKTVILNVVLTFSDRDIIETAPVIDTLYAALYEKLTRRNVSYDVYECSEKVVPVTVEDARCQI